MVAKSNASDTACAAGAGEKRFKGVRMRSWGKWVSEIRLPNTRARLWLGSYATAHQAARAFDVAAVCLRGSSVALNFPDSPPAYAPFGLPHHQIQELATAAAAAVSVSTAHASPSSPTAVSYCHLAMPSLENPFPSSPGTSLISDESDTATSRTSRQSEELEEQDSWALRSSFSSSVAALHKELLMKCELDEALWDSSAFDSWITACAAFLPMNCDDDDDDDDVFVPHCLWSL